MKTLLFLFVILPTIIFCQESKDSKLFRYWAQQERKKSLEDTLNKLEYYKKETSFYIKGEKLGEYPKQTYYSIIKSINDILKIENDVNKKSYYDTLLFVYDKLRIINYDSLVTNKMRLVANLNSTNPDKFKIDSIFRVEKDLSTQLYKDYYKVYFNNLYLIYNQNTDTTSMQRLFDEYVNLKIQKLDGIDYYENIFNNIFSSKDSISQIENHFWKYYSKDKTVNELMWSLVITNDLKSQKIYKKLIDNFIVIDPTPTAYFRLANYYEDSGNSQLYQKTLTDIKNKFPQYKDEINYNECVNEYNKGRYKSCYDLALKIGGSYKGKALKLAGLCVGNLAMSSGITTFERKCNYYLAINLLKSSNKLGENNNTLISNYTTLLPNDLDKFEEGNPKTQYLSTFGVTVNIN